MKPAIGRPRDPRIDTAVLRKTAALVRKQGYADVTIAAIAAAAGTTKPAIYRRWPSKAHLVHEAVFPEGELFTLPDTGSLAGDLREMLRRTRAAFTAPAARAALPGLVGEVVADPTLHGALLERFGGVFADLTTRLDDARERGEIRTKVDSSAVVELLTGAVLSTLLIRSVDAMDESWVEQTADLITRGLSG
ncbi:MAG TPA: TetR/AcrR family transcriptional regulator [Marmoricola sp.]|nr:TetR/AcrR family transcriptional regulator [Marmoricola sp.]